MTSQPVTVSDLSFFRSEAERRRAVFEERRKYGGRKSKWIPSPEMQMKLVNCVKLSVWMVIAIVIMSYIILKNTSSELESPGNSFQDHTRQIRFHSQTEVENILLNSTGIHGPRVLKGKKDSIQKKKND